MKNENPDEREILNAIDSSITQLDEQRLAELNNLKELQEIKNEVFSLENKRLAKKYGADHPRVQKTEARLTYNQEMFFGLDKEIEKAKIKKEPFPNNSWRVHGRVYGNDKTPLKAQTVFLSDEVQKRIPDLPYACTDNAGYYSITIEQEQIKKIENAKLYLTVSGKNREITCTSPESLKAMKGIIDYQDIFIASESCGEPPSDNKNTPG